MAPPRARPAVEETKAEALNSKERLSASSQGVAGRGRRNAPINASQANAMKETAQQSLPANSGISQASNGASGISWPNMEREVLQAYRNAYRLDTPSSFKSPLSHIVLANTRIGRYSPTMARKNTKRRVTKDQLALAVRKSFNSLAVSENEVIVNLLYKAKSQDTPFRMRFAPSRTR